MTNTNPDMSLALRTYEGIAEPKQTTTTTVSRTLLSKRFNEQNNSCAGALYIFVHFIAVLAKQQQEMTKFCVVYGTWTTTVNFSCYYLTAPRRVQITPKMSTNMTRY